MKNTTKATGQDTRESARDYLRRGRMPIPVPWGRKGPVIPRWQELRIKESEIDQHFKENDNVGVLLGEPSGGLIDVDLDSQGASLLAETFLPRTDAVFGRPSKTSSHWLYVCDKFGASAQFKDPSGRIIVEIRSTGLQTIFPPSHHSGEQVAWQSDGEPAKVTGAYLRSRVAMVAAAELLAVHWPNQGSRQEAALALAGALLHEGFEEIETQSFIRAVAQNAGDEETEKRADAAECTQRKILAGENVTAWTTLESLLGTDTARLARKWLRIAIGTSSNVGESDPPATSNGTKGKNDRFTNLELMVGITSEAELFHSPDGEKYLTFPVKEHRETWRINSPATRHWLARRFSEQFGRLPSRECLSDAIEMLEDAALHEGPEYEVFIRIAPLNGSIYLDLCGPEWQVIEIGPNGWRVVSNPPVRFRRTPRMKSLPLPVPGGKIDELRGLLNAQEDGVWTLVVGWLVGCFHPTGPYLILVLQGEAGTAKSTTARMLRSLIDPSRPPLTSMTSKEDDLLIAAKNSRVLGFDNLSSIPPWISDSLCRLATGGGLSKRRLFTDEDEVILEASRPIILTGIEDLASREDLAERSISLLLPAIPSVLRRLERTLQPAFNEAHPRILGAILDGVSLALRRVDEVQLQNLPRMADAVQWISAAESSFGWSAGTFQRAFEENQNDGAANYLETDLIASAIAALMEDYTTWEGTATDLLALLNTRSAPEVQKSKSWPSGARAIGGRVRRLSTVLRKLGIEILFSRAPGTRQRLISILPQGLANVQNGPTVPKAPEDPGSVNERDGRDDKTSSQQATEDPTTFNGRGNQ